MPQTDIDWPSAFTGKGGRLLAPPPAAKPTTSEINRSRTRDWEQFVDGRIAAALVERDKAHKVLRDAVAAFVADTRKKLRQEFAAEINSEHRKIVKLERRLSEFEKTAELQRGGVVAVPRF